MAPTETGSSDKLKRKASEGAEAARGAAEAEGRRQTRKWTARAGETAGHVADAAQAAEESLRGQEDWLADAAGTLRESLSQLSQTARDKDFDEIKGDLQRLARERPAVFMGAAVAAGLALGRVLRSSAAHDDGASDLTPPADRPATRVASPAPPAASRLDSDSTGRI